ncbi:MAG: exosortase/archaeosortase family protein [Phycisphaerales bacterium]|nr:exosortase/archaeosortase family protein [Phycisphaerales bacterium]
MSTLRRTWDFSLGLWLGVLTLVAVAATIDLWRDIFAIGWQDPENSHLILAPFVAAWLIWVRRERIRFVRPNPSVSGPLVVIAGWISVRIGYQYGIIVAQHGGALLIVCCAALTMLGPQVVRLFLPAAAALLFILPVPGRIREAIALPLQEHTAQITHYLLTAIGIPLERGGSVLTINGTEVAVAEACNGMRMVTALMLITFAFVFSVPMRQRIRLFFLILSPVIALLVNVIRLVPTVLLYGYASESVATTFHDISGWIMLFVALGILWAMLGLLRWLEIAVSPHPIGEED